MKSIPMASSVTLSENLFLVSLAVGPAGRQEFELIPGENVVGRKRDASINLAHLDVSREHCIIFSKDGMLALFDHGSRNGTFVNGHKVAPRSSVSLFVNDTVGFGVTSATVESYIDSKTPFLVYRVTKKIPTEVFERLALEREKAQCVKRRADFLLDVPAMKRTKSDASVSSAALPTSIAVQMQQPPEQPIIVPESDTRLHNSASSVRSDGMEGLYVIDDSSNESEPSHPSNVSESKKACGTESSSSAVESSTLQNISLTKSVDENSTLKNGSSIQSSELEGNTPGPSNSSKTNSSLRSNDDTRSHQKNREEEASCLGRSSKKVISVLQNDKKSSSAKTGLFKTPPLGVQIKKEKVDKKSEPPRYVEFSSSRIENEDGGSKSTEIQTFSLISDDEDDDEGMMSSQIFIKADESQSFVQPPLGMDTSAVDDEILEIYDSDEDSFFDHLSQTLSQSFVLPEESKKEEKKKKKGLSKSDKLTKTKENRSEKRGSKKETPSKNTLKQEKVASETVTPDEKKSKPIEKPSTSKRDTSKSKTRKDVDGIQVKVKTRSQHKGGTDCASNSLSDIKVKHSKDQKTIPSPGKNSKLEQLKILGK